MTKNLICPQTLLHSFNFYLKTTIVDNEIECSDQLQFFFFEINENAAKIWNNGLKSFMNFSYGKIPGEITSTTLETNF